ncbi:MAG: hypothetical protein ABIH87_03185 [bacterium]
MISLITCHLTREVLIVGFNKTACYAGGIGAVLLGIAFGIAGDLPGILAGLVAGFGVGFVPFYRSRK